MILSFTYNYFLESSIKIKRNKNEGKDADLTPLKKCTNKMSDHLKLC